MSDAHTTTVDRLRQFRDAKTEQAMDRILEAQAQDARTRGTLPAGTRVLDLVTGLEGVVLERAAAWPAPFGQFAVRLDRGDSVTRFARELLARPTPPTV